MVAVLSGPVLRGHGRMGGRTSRRGGCTSARGGPLVKRAVAGSGLVRIVATLVVIGAIFAAIRQQSDPVANAFGGQLVISQVYGAGGNSGTPPPTYTNDFVEIFNPGTSTVALT